MRFVFWLPILFLLQAACASPWKTGTIYAGNDQREVELRKISESVAPGTVVIVSEEHGHKPHHANQIEFLKKLATPVSVGLEFLARDHQAVVDRYVRGELPEAEFLKQVDWGKNDFADYREQVLYPAKHGGKTLALNASRTLTGKVAKMGIAGLSKEERAMLPPDFALGNATYRDRFAQSMQDHMGAAGIDRFFEAQCVWDDTMAWVASEYLKANPQQKLVIIVGDFHAAYGGGLPDRLKARGLKNVTTISQVNLAEETDEEEEESILPHAKWGARADYIWISR